MAITPTWSIVLVPVQARAQLAQLAPALPEGLLQRDKRLDNCRVIVNIMGIGKAPCVHQAHRVVPALGNLRELLHQGRLSDAADAGDVYDVTGAGLAGEHRREFCLLIMATDKFLHLCHHPIQLDLVLQ
jgi:hypothetical protein